MSDEIIAWANTLDRDTALQAHADAKDKVKYAEAVEKALRLRIIALAFPGEASDAEGVRNLDVGGGWKLQATFKVYYKLPAFDKVRPVLTRIRELGTTEGQAAYERLVKFTPDLSVGEYKKTGGEPRKIIDEIVTTKPGLPDLKLIPPAV